MQHEDVQNQERTKARRFAPEPIEQSTRSNKGTQSTPKIDATKPRRFVPQVVEQESRSNREGSDAKEQDAKPKARRFAPQPVETSYSSSKGKGSKAKFLPEPIESSSRSNRSGPKKDANRKFAPVLIDTAKRTRKAGSDSQINPQDYRTEYGHTIHASEHRRHVAKKKALVEDDSHQARRNPIGHSIDFADLPRRPPSPLDGSAPARLSVLAPARNHSFRCPDLDTIESSESERESTPSSLSCSPGQGSPLTASDTSFTDFYKHATRIRESVDENFSHYLLQLEAKKAQERMREQALAAFPNSDFHEPVQHYVDDGQESDEFEYEDRVVTWDGFDEDGLLTLVRRRDSTKLSWEQMELQRHAERMEQDRKANGVTNMRESSRSPWWNPVHGGTIHDSDAQMRSMRDRARPPMLGRDLVFPRCPSPEPARFDVTQGSSVLRKQMSSRLGSNEEESAVPSLWAASAAAKKSSGDKRIGLWGGFCAATEEGGVTGGLAPPLGPTGLMTPRDEPANPFEQSFAKSRTLGGLNSGDASHGMIATPPTPPAEVRSAPGIAGIDTILVTDYENERDITVSYPDNFITQVFNYLSLGYPALARPFDEELAKISRISIAELRQDDVRARQSPRGYIRLGQDFEGGGGEEVVSETECVRWRALKLYVYEWARQEKNMVASPIDSGAAGAVQHGAVIERRGSWGI
ncbi:uncharacterized protein K489DRAFT_386569 [Dissoconium aciculare CBS 342.82]|uniref:Uncharacterized protein n=1 Tax=Dissoconium aciculare CBS 342.82 TaxID=1314786 RepID=A0A6J3MDL0_9PEZI|nr:uncharacterized protein K489DRAFT_386569 [Dissoconium aciculare CBS 342.82]KAF1826101.1 hypothetical protein K489DRAFT_386569 [Dissoconium aciculare CBS 342.82]